MKECPKGHRSWPDGCNYCYSCASDLPVSQTGREMAPEERNLGLLAYSWAILLLSGLSFGICLLGEVFVVVEGSISLPVALVAEYIVLAVVYLLGFSLTLWTLGATEGWRHYDNLTPRGTMVANLSLFADIAVIIATCRVCEWYYAWREVMEM